MEIQYNKNSNISLFESLEKLNLYDIQNFIPIYTLFYEMNINNNDVVNFDIQQKLISVEKIISYNTIEGNIKISENKKRKQTIFLKYAPIVDPIRYMAGKYKDDILLLPQFDDSEVKEYKTPYQNKINNPFNSSYVDGVFSYISSVLYNKGFINAINFHGMFLGMHKNLKVNIIDDLEFLTESSYFHDHLNELFDIDNDDIFSVDSNQSGNNKKPIKIMESLSQDKIIDTVVENDDTITYLSDIIDIQEFTDFKCMDDVVYLNLDNDDASSTCSSASSLTNDSNDIDDEHDSEYSCEEINDDLQEDESSDTSSEISYVEGIVHDFPVSIICMENCDRTLDHLMNEEMSTNHWISCLMQIIVSLIVFQKKFDFTHNDLHTSNVMYVTTTQKYINYKINDKFYRVPTFGRIYKIIDFGRAIYSVNNLLIYSDAFDKKEDAATQYNFGPIYDTDKQEIKPNPSFDLSRLGCSLYDYFDCYETKHKNDKLLVNLIKSWCTDDKGKNILYKSSGEERYPEFKLYKMIARTVHHCIPIEQLNNPLFSEFSVNDEKAENYIDINSL